MEGFSLAPYSLGKLIDWKHYHKPGYIYLFVHIPPYSLGKLIDWKLSPSL